MDGNTKPGLKAPLKGKATRAGKPGGRLDSTSSLWTDFETFPSHTGLLADAQLFDDLLVRLRVTPF